MDNLTHSLIGLAASKAGLERLSPGTTALCVLASNAPDADIVSAFFGRWTYLHHHRGITHSIVGTITLSLALPLVFYLGDLIISRVRKRSATFKLRGLMLASIIVSATHPLVDWTNNYGVRFLLPWNSRWFYGDFVFIIDPFLWLTLGGAVFLVTSNSKKKVVGWIAVALIPTCLVLFGPADRGGLTNAMALRVVWLMALSVLIVLFWRGAGRHWGTKIPIAAFGMVLLYMTALCLVHKVALQQAKSEAASIASENVERVVDVAAMPTLANPFNWLCVVETERAAYRFSLVLGRGGDRRNLVRHERPEALNAQAMAEATSDFRSRIFLDFARFPVARIVDEDCATQTLVQFADLRYTEPGQNRGTFVLEVPVSCPALGQIQR
jgi:inner membrane protein